MRFLIRLYIVSLFILTLDLFNHEGKKSCMIIFTQAQFANLKIHDKKNQTGNREDAIRKKVSVQTKHTYIHTYTISIPIFIHLSVS